MSAGLMALAALLLLLGRGDRRAPARRLERLAGRDVPGVRVGSVGDADASAGAATARVGLERSVATAAPTGGRDRATRLVRVGAAPVVVLAGWTVAGWWGLTMAAAALPLAGAAVRRIEQRAGPAGDAQERAALPLLLDLLAAALDAGAPLADALAHVAVVAPPVLATRLVRVSALLRLGAEPADAWSAVSRHATLASVAATAVRSADSGVRLADGLRRRATEARADLRAAGVARANRVGVLALLPLGLCFLPAFVCLGVVPVVVGIAGDALGPLTP